ncbi:unnamed protein product, partial [Trichogramma brassicae]
VGEIFGIKIYHYAGSLNFVNSRHLGPDIYRKIGVEPSSVLKYRAKLAKRSNGNYTSSDDYENQSSSIRCIIIDMSAVTHLDSAGVSALHGPKLYRISIVAAQKRKERLEATIGHHFALRCLPAGDSMRQLIEHRPTAILQKRCSRPQSETVTQQVCGDSCSEIRNIDVLGVQQQRQHFNETRNHESMPQVAHLGFLLTNISY